MSPMSFLYFGITVIIFFVITVTLFFLWITERQKNALKSQELLKAKNTLFNEQFRSKQTDVLKNELQLIFWEYEGLHKILSLCDDLVSTLSVPSETEEKYQIETYDNAARIKRFLQRVYLVSARPSTSAEYDYLVDVFNDYRNFDFDGSYLPSQTIERIKARAF